MSISPENGRMPDSEPFHGDTLSPEAFERERFGVISAFNEGVLSDSEAVAKLEQLAIDNPTIHAIHDSHANREVNS